MVYEKEEVMGVPRKALMSFAAGVQSFEFGAWFP